jgi:hypothetical protein
MPLRWNADGWPEATVNDVKTGASNNGTLPAFRVVELPRPNSGTFTTEQAEARKDLILSNRPSGPLKDWKNPYFGLAIHVDANDKLTVYAMRPPSNEAAEKRAEVSIDDIQKLERSIIQFGNPHGVLITSDLPLRNSVVIHKLMKVLFVPSIQIFYVASE